MNNHVPSFNRRSKQEILSDIERNGGAYRSHGDPELRTIAEPTVTERAKASLMRLDDAGVSSQDKRRRGLKVVSGALAAGILAVTPVGDAVGDIIQDSGDRVIANFDSHNQPPGGKPVVYRGGVAFEPGTDNTIVMPPVVIEP